MPEIQTGSSAYIQEQVTVHIAKGLKQIMIVHHSVFYAVLHQITSLKCIHYKFSFMSFPQSLTQIFKSSMIAPKLSWVMLLFEKLMKNINSFPQKRHRASMVAQAVKNLPAMQDTWVQSWGWEDPLEKGMASHFNILAWRIPWTEELGGVWFMGLQKVRRNWVTSTICIFTLIKCAILFSTFMGLTNTTDSSRLHTPERIPFLGFILNTSLRSKEMANKCLCSYSALSPFSVTEPFEQNSRVESIPDNRKGNEESCHSGIFP